MAEWIQLAFATVATISSISKNMGNSLWNFVSNSGVYYLQLHVNCRGCCQLRWTLSVL